MEKNKILIIDCDSQYTQLMARSVRELGVYSEILFWNSPVEKMIEFKPSGIIISGGPRSILNIDAPTVPMSLLNSGIPILAVGSGMQLLAHQLGGKVQKTSVTEYGQK